MPPITSFSNPYAQAAYAYWNTNVRKPIERDINPFTGQSFLTPRQFSPLEITAMQRFGIDPSSLATPEGQQDFATAVALVQQQAVKDQQARFAPVIPDDRLGVAAAFRQNAARQATTPATTIDATAVVRANDPNTPFVNFIATNPRGGNYQMTAADKQVVASALNALPSNTAKENYSNLMVANPYVGKGTFQDYVNNVTKTNTALQAPGGFLQSDPLAAF